MFHVSQLKQHVPDHTPVYTSLPNPLALDTEELQPAEILDRRLVKKGNAAILQVLIRWSELPATAATWEDYEAVHQRFPDAPAWGQAGSIGEGTFTAVQCRAMSVGLARKRTEPWKRKLKEGVFELEKQKEELASQTGACVDADVEVTVCVRE